MLSVCLKKRAQADEKHKLEGPHSAGRSRNHFDRKPGARANRCVVDVALVERESEVRLSPK